ncbi:MAG: hypothetical protein JNJ48_08665 [Phycisphaerae bacterium]|nr:hypothetical protein [Phycisphaerae bacterium]
MSVRTRVLGVLLVLAAAALGGCAGSGGRAAPELFSVLESRPATGELTAQRASVDVAPEVEYEIAGEPGAAWLVWRQAVSSGDGWVVVKARRGAGTTGEPEVVSEMPMTRRDDGAIVSPRTSERDDAVVTEFEPALVVMPGVLRAGDTAVQSLHMVVRPADRPDRVKTQGDATHEIRYEADETVRVPAGRFRTQKVVAVLRANLGTAKVENTTESWHAPGAGIVAERRVERVTVFGVPIRSSDRTVVARRIGAVPADR